jgi:glycosyltransferase involved in cell wall biosynthesis
MNNTLVLITAGYPYGYHETFLETEILFLSEQFEKVYIIALDPSNDSKRIVPDNCVVHTAFTRKGVLPKFKAIFGLTNRQVIKELIIIRKDYKLLLNLGIIKTLLMSFVRSKEIAKSIETIIPPSERIVYYSYWSDDGAIALGLLKERFSQLKAVSRMHRWDVYFDQNKYNYLPFRQFIYQQLNSIISISDDGINYAQRIWGVNGSKLILSRLGIKEQSALQKMEREDFLLFSCSNVTLVKRVDLISEALSQISEKRLTWIHIGEGPEMDLVKRKVENLPNNISVELMGRKTNSEVIDFYKSTMPDVFINVSSSEGVPVSIMEAFSFGVPCIATNVGGSGEIVNSENGILLSNDPSIAEVSQAIRSLLDSKEVEKKGKVAYSTWKEKYNAKKNYTTFSKYLMEL